MPDPISDMIQKDSERVRRAFGAAATIISEELRNLPRGAPERAAIFRERMAAMTRGYVPPETVLGMERLAAQIRSMRPERWIPFPRFGKE